MADSRQQQVKEAFQLKAARLYRPSAREQAKQEIESDKQALFSLFERETDLEKRLALFTHFKRYMENTNAFASFNGSLKGYKAFGLGLRVGEDKTLQNIIKCMNKSPDASDRQICEHLDHINNRLFTLNPTKLQCDLIWARMPKNWRTEIEKRTRGKQPRPGELWTTALRVIPGRVMTYLSRARKDAKNAQIRNALFFWPRVVREVKKQNSISRDGGKKTAARLPSDPHCLNS